jgi:arylsulfatase A-like enzyme
MAAVGPNVLLIVFDTARADAFEPYGSGLGTSPTVAQLGRRGTVIRHAIAPSNWTMPSHVSMMAGALPRSIGLAGAPKGKPRECRPLIEAQRDRLLAEVLRNQGYATAAVSANAWVSPHTGFDVGFERFERPASNRQGRLHARDLRSRAAWARDALRATADDGATQAEEIISRWIGERDDRPFFWFVNLIECHSPYMPPKPYNDLSGLERMRVGEQARKHLTLGDIWRTCLTEQRVPDATLSRMRHLYGRSIRLMDDWLARILQRLDDAKVLDDTLVILTSDHGENLGEGGLIGHSFSLDNRLIHVPLVVAGPGAFDDAGIFSLASLPQKIAGALSLGEHPWEEDPVPEGIAVSQYSFLAADDPRVPKAISDWHLDDEAILTLTGRATSATDGRWKVVRNGDRERVFDLESDPLERSPAQGSSAPALERLRRAIALAHDDAPATVAPVADQNVDAAEMADLEDRLRELGYL